MDLHMQRIICVHKPPSEGRKFIFGLFGHHRWGLFFSGNLEVIHDFANTASRWMLGLANRVPGSSRGMLFYTSSIFVIVVWDAEPIKELQKPINWKQRLLLTVGTFWDVYCRFHISTEIDDLVPSWTEKRFANIQLQNNFLVLYLTQQQQRSRLCEII